MKKGHILFFVLLSAIISYNFIPAESGRSNIVVQDQLSSSSHVIVKVEGLTLKQYNAVSTAFMKNPDIEIAYYCLESGVLAIHYKHSGLSDADVQLAIKTDLIRIIKNTNIRILDVETRDTEGDSRC